MQYVGWIVLMFAGIPLIAGGAQTMSDASELAFGQGIGLAFIGLGVGLIGRAIAGLAATDEAKRQAGPRGSGLFGKGGTFGPEA